MGILDGVKNVFKSRQSGDTSNIDTTNERKTPSFADLFRSPERSHEHRQGRITRQTAELLRKNPSLTDEDLLVMLNLEIDSSLDRKAVSNGRNDFKRWQVLHGKSGRKDDPGAGSGVPKDDPIGPRPGNNGFKTVRSGGMDMLSLSPEDAVARLDEEEARVSFGLSGTAKFMDNFNQIWSWFGPILFALGTIGEIFLVLWERQRAQSLFTGFTIVAVSVISEGTLLAISFASKRLRNRADHCTTGWTEKDKHKLALLKKFWFLLVLMVAATQIAFVVVQTDPTNIGTTGVWIIAIARSVAAAVADCYTAFVSEEKPTSGDVALETQSQKTVFRSKMLAQQAKETEMINTGLITVQQMGINAEIEQDDLQTNKKVRFLQNKVQLDSLIAQAELANMTTRMATSGMRAMFDPLMEEQERERMLNLMSMIGKAHRESTEAKQRVISEDPYGKSNV